MLSLQHPWLSIAVAECRLDAANALAKLPTAPDVLIMDDGFSHLALNRDLDLLCIDCSSPPWGMLPAGRLREPISSLGRANGFILNSIDGAYRNAWEAAIARFKPGALQVEMHYAVSGLRQLYSGISLPIETMFNKRVLAVSALGRPARFEAQLSHLGASVVVHRFSDHHRYSQSDWFSIQSHASKAKCDVIITTEKDAVKLQNVISQTRIPVYTLAINAAFSSLKSEQSLFSLVMQGIENGRKRLDESKRFSCQD